MTTPVLLIVIAAIGGMTISVQAQMMGVIDRALGTTEAIFITYGSGGLIIGLVMAWLRGGNLAQGQQLPWWAWAAGLLGLVIVGAISYCTPRMGLVAMLTVLVLAQFATGAVIDHFGLLGAQVRPLDWSRITGLIVALCGAWLVIR